MSRNINQINPVTDTFLQWLSSTNAMANAFLKTVTVESNSVGDTTTGNGFVSGIFGATVLASDTLRGGTVASSNTLTITSNVNVSSAQMNVTSNTLFEAANIVLKTNSTVTAITVSTDGTQSNVSIGGNNMIISSNVTVSGMVLNIPVGNSSNRPTGSNGMVRLNTDTAALELYANGSWVSVVASNNYVDGSLVLLRTGDTASGQMTMANLVSNTIYASNSTTNTVTVSGALSVSGNAAVSGTLSVTANVTASAALAVIGAATLSNTLNVTGAASVGNTLSVTDNVLLGSGKKIDFASGDVTISHSANALAFANAAYYSIDAPLVPSTNGVATGNTTNRFGGTFYSTGAAINFGNNDSIVTHSAGVLNVSNGDLRVASAGSNTNSVVTVGGSQILTGKTLSSPTITTPSISDASLTGTVTAPTQTAGTSNTTVATTSFVDTAIAALSAIYQPLKTILTSLGNLANANGYLKNDGSGTLSWASVNVDLTNYKEYYFTSTGNFTPNTSANAYEVTMVGAGGTKGGNNTGNGGGEGGAGGAVKFRGTKAQIGNSVVAVTLSPNAATTFGTFGNAPRGSDGNTQTSNATGTPGAAGAGGTTNLTLMYSVAGRASNASGAQNVSHQMPDVPHFYGAGGGTAYTGGGNAGAGGFVRVREYF